MQRTNNELLTNEEMQYRTEILNACGSWETQGIFPTVNFTPPNDREKTGHFKLDLFVTHNSPNSPLLEKLKNSFFEYDKEAKPLTIFTLNFTQSELIGTLNSIKKINDDLKSDEAKLKQAALNEVREKKEKLMAIEAAAVAKRELDRANQLKEERAQVEARNRLQTDLRQKKTKQEATIYCLIANLNAISECLANRNRVKQTVKSMIHLTGLFSRNDNEALNIKPKIDSFINMSNYELCAAISNLHEVLTKRKAHLNTITDPTNFYQDELRLLTTAIKEASEISDLTRDIFLLQVSDGKSGPELTQRASNPGRP